MSSNANAASKTVATRNNKNISENKQQLTIPVPPSEHLVLCDNTLIEIKVKTMGQKRTSTMISSPTNRKDVEEKRRPSCSGDSQPSWGHVFREQNKAAFTKSLHKVIPKAFGSKSSKYNHETKETKKSTLSHQKQDHKYLDEFPVKQTPLKKKAEEPIKSTPRTTNRSSTSVPSSSESILVFDKSVQCNQHDFADDDRFTPVHTLRFLIKELEHLVKDEKANEILTNMKQVLYNIPTEHGEANPEVMDLRAKLEEQTRQLEKISKKMNSSCAILRNERDDLQYQIKKYVSLLSEAREKQLDLEAAIKTSKQELEEALKAAENKEKTIATLKEELKGHEFSQKIIADLRRNLAEQTDLTRQRHLEAQYLALEKEKLLVLSSYKDTQLNDLRSAVKELYANQLNDVKDISNHGETSNPGMSLVHGGVVCSSPTSTSSHESNLPTSWHDISDISVSTGDHDRPNNENMQRDLRKSNKPLALLETQIENSKIKPKNTEQSPAKDSALEFISLPGGESSLTLLPSYKDLGCTEINKCDNTDMEDPAALSNQKNVNRRNFKCTNKVLSSENLNSSTEKILKEETDAKEPVKITKSMELNKKPNFGRKTEGIDNIPKDNPITPSLTEQFRNIFQDIRFQSGMIIKVPSPPRSYPHPEYSDSTLPSISSVSDLNAIQANDT